MSPAREDRLIKIESVLKKNKSQFSKFDVKSGQSIIGSKDY